MTDVWVVEIVEFGTNRVEHSIQCNSERSAERVERSVIGNLNHEKFYTRVASRTMTAAEEGAHKRENVRAKARERSR